MGTRGWPVRPASPLTSSALTAAGGALAVTQNAIVPVGNTSLTLLSNEGSDSTNNSLNSRRICYAPLGGPITDISLGAPGFSLNNPEADLPVPYTMWNALEYPLGAPPRRFYWGGAPSITVPPGRVMPESEPRSIYIPAGTAYAVKSSVTWTGTLPLRTFLASRLVGEWTTRGVGLADQTLDNATLVGTTTLFGFAPVVFARYGGPPIIAGILGDSIAAATEDWQDQWGQLGWGRFIRNQHPWVNLSRSSDSMALYLQRDEGRSLLLRRLTHVVMQYGSNDVFGGRSLLQMQADWLSIVMPMLTRGQKVIAVTILPRTTSTDGWLTLANQTLTNVPQDAVRQNFNAWLRANWAAYGCSGLLDIASRLESSGKWLADAGGVACTFAGLSHGTITGGAITAAPYFLYNSLYSAGVGMPSNQTALPCEVLPYPGTGGSGATATWATNASGGGAGTAATVVTGGSGYTYPPMISPLSAYCGDGIHPNARGRAVALTAEGFGPGMFTP